MANRNSNRHPGTARRSGGFTLVELLVALLIATIAIGAVLALYLNSSQTVRYQSALLAMQENGRFAVGMITRSARMAGYDNPLDDAEDNTSFINPITVTELPAVVLKGTTSNSGTLLTVAGLKSDAGTLGLRYQGGPRIVDCHGQPVATTSYVTNVYGISTDGALVCASQHGPAGAITPLKLVEGVEDMEILYGIDVDGTGLANRFVAASAVSDWEEVVSLRIMLLMNSVNPALVDADNICLGCVHWAGSTDRLLRAEFQTSVAIRNYQPPASS